MFVAEITSEQVFQWIAENAHILGPIIAVAFLFLLARQVRKKLLIENLPTSKVKGVFIGFVQLEGTSESRSPLRSYLAEVDCVYYSTSITEHWQRTYTVTVTDSKGNTRTETRTDSGWATVFSQQDMQSFEIEDETGRLLINPAGAEIEPLSVFNQTVSRFDPLYYGKGPQMSVPNSTGRRNFSETAIPLDVPITVVGNAREREDRVEPMVGYDERAPFFLISTRAEQEIVRGLGWGSFFVIVAVVLFGAGGFPLRESVMLGTVTWSLYIPHLLTCLGVVILVRTMLQINGLIEIRSRVKQAFSVLDTQLQRRFDLIPNLVTTVKQHSEFEASFQELLVELRSENLIHMVGDRVRLNAEKYPDLKTNQIFLQLQKELIDTEDRIELSRSYCVQIVTNYNAQLEKFPNSILASVARLRMAEPPEILMSREEGESVNVSFEPTK